MSGSPIDGAEAIAAVLRARLATSSIGGTLRIYGQWFGGKPLDNHHSVVGVATNDDTLIVDFSLGEHLVVRAPRGAAAVEGVEAGMPVVGFEIASAASVTWTWYSYAHPQVSTPEAFRELRYEPLGDGVTRTGRQLGTKADVRTLPAAARAVELLSYAPRTAAST